MKRTFPGARAALALALCVPVVVAMTTVPAAASGTSLAAATWAQGGFARQVYAPYFETWTKDRLPAVARASGARDLVLAFLQTPKRGRAR